MSQTKAFKKEDVQAAVWEDTLEDSPLVLEHAGQWIDKGKYQYQENILKETVTGKFYRYLLSKSGSHFTYYTYSYEWAEDEIELTEVYKSTKIVEVWLGVVDK